jgi:hypothetical protein
MQTQNSYNNAHAKRGVEMITEVMTKEMFLEFIDKLVDKNEVVIFTNKLENIKLLSEKKQNYAKVYSSVFPNDIFKSKDSVADLMNCKLTGIIICHNKYLNDKLQNQFKEIKNENKS